MEGGNSIPRGSIISCLKSFQMISKGCLYHIGRFQFLDSEIHPIELVPVVREFLKVFLNDLSDIPPEREINFGIDLLVDTNPISIPPYGMASEELKELKAQLKDLVDIGFIIPSISPLGALI